MTEASPSRKTVEARARRAAAARGWLVRKSRKAPSEDNRGGFQLVDSFFGVAVLGKDFDLSAEEVIALFPRGPKA